MKCPYCGGSQLAVLESRPSKGQAGIRRRRDCVDCKRRFTTYERVSDPVMVVIKKDGRREPFDRDKLVRKLQVAFHKRPVATEELDSMVDRVERTLLQEAAPEIPSTLIGQAVLSEIKPIDKVAWIRFASVYLAFETLDDFEKAIDGQNN